MNYKTKANLTLIGGALIVITAAVLAGACGIVSGVTLSKHLFFIKMATPAVWITSTIAGLLVAMALMVAAAFVALPVFKKSAIYRWKSHLVD